MQKYKLQQPFYNCRAINWISPCVFGWNNWWWVSFRFFPTRVKRQHTDGSDIQSFFIQTKPNQSERKISKTIKREQIDKVRRLINFYVNHKIQVNKINFHKTAHFWLCKSRTLNVFQTTKRQDNVKYGLRAFVNSNFNFSISPATRGQQFSKVKYESWSSQTDAQTKESSWSSRTDAQTKEYSQVLLNLPSFHSCHAWWPR